MVFEQALGPHHPTLGTALSSLGYVAGWQGDFEFGRVALERSIRILETSVGRDHYYYSVAAGNLGALAFLAGDYATAGEYYELARQSLVRQLGPAHPSVGYALVNLAELALTQGQLALALEHADASLAILESKLGREHIDLLLPLETRGRALLGLERAHEAAEPLQRALTIHERAQHGEAELTELRAALARALAQPD
jgi:tetratricopeptide (TPR) repeat protein